jgi:ferredoxin
VALREAQRRRVLEATPGEKLLAVLKRAGLPLLAVCGGNGACGTCRVSIDPAWIARLAAAEKRELRLLSHLKAAPNDRLSCRITLTAALDGLRVHACESSANPPLT